jgi:hypothetical protein
MPAPAFSPPARTPRPSQLDVGAGGSAEASLGCGGGGGRRSPSAEGADASDASMASPSLDARPLQLAGRGDGQDEEP